MCLCRAGVVYPLRPPYLPGRRTLADADGPALAGMAQARQLPGSPVAVAPSAQRADPEGPELPADGRDDRRPHRLAAREPGRRPQLGLPLQLDPRLDVHAVG